MNSSLNNQLATNAIILSTVSEITQKVISDLDGSGLSVKAEGEGVEHAVLAQLINSRIKLKLMQKQGGLS